MSVEVVKKQFSIEDYYRIAAAGVFREDDRVELIEGEIIEMSPIGSRHAACVGRLTELLGDRARSVAMLWVQNPVQINDYSEPVPDVTLLRRRADFYAHAKPLPEDVLLLVEVSDTTVNYDRKVKLPLYARGGVPEVWVVNLSEELIEVYARPADGAYQETRLVRRGESVTASAIDGLTVEADAVLG
ncbi:MAG: Uma2 family endonuclease [Acidobacteria bacterium]|nr:Uma2 family endonuclease [Acidobacteriota bacterium]MBV9927851.1 Uma2 family endonuclease [Acidobacteriota bacterium]